MTEDKIRPVYRGETAPHSSHQRSTGPSKLAERIMAVISHIDNPVPVALIYLALFTIAELLTVMGKAWIGQGLYLILLFILLIHMALPQDWPIRRFLLGLTFVPLIRVVSLSLPLNGIPRLYWYMIVSIPLFAATFIALRSLGLRLRLIQVNRGALLLQLAFGFTGLLFGWIEYLILRPDPLISTYTWSQFLLAAAILLVCTGLLEEVIFRGIMQQTSVEQLGRWAGILYVTLIFAILHVGYHSLLDVLFVFVIGLIFGLFVSRTGSLLGVTLSHGLTNIIFFLVIPYWLASQGSLPFLTVQ